MPARHEHGQVLSDVLHGPVGRVGQHRQVSIAERNGRTRFDASEVIQEGQILIEEPRRRERLPQFPHGGTGAQLTAVD